MNAPRLTIVSTMYRSRPFLERFLAESVQAGLAHARGELIFLIDCDLEVAPATLAGFHAKLVASGAALVYGYQEARKCGWFGRSTGAVFWGGLNRLSSVPIAANQVTERLMTRRFVQALLRPATTACSWAA